MKKFGLILTFSAILVFSAISNASEGKIALFAGHTTLEDNRGAQAYPYGFENVFNDTIVNYFKYIDDSNYQYVVEPTLKNLSLQERVNLSNNIIKPDLYIEVHHDAGEEKDFEQGVKEGDSSKWWEIMSGFSVHFNTDGNKSPEESQRLACILAEEMENQGFKPDTYHAKYQGMKLIDEKNHPGVYLRNSPQSLYVLKNNDKPAVILECGYVRNPIEVKKMADPTYHEKVKNAISKAVERFSMKTDSNSI